MYSKRSPNSDFKVDNISTMPFELYAHFDFFIHSQIYNLTKKKIINILISTYIFIFFKQRTGWDKDMYMNISTMLAHS